LAMHLAAMLAHSFSVLTFLDSTVVRFETFARRYGVERSLRSVRSVGIPVLELHVDPQRTLERLAEAARVAVERDGAHALVLGCGGFPNVEEAVEERLRAGGFDVPLIEPSVVALKLAESLVDLRLAHSKRTFPTTQLNAFVAPEQPAATLRP
jgi:allantoin racemase